MLQNITRKGDFFFLEKIKKITAVQRKYLRHDLN